MQVGIVIPERALNISVFGKLTDVQVKDKVVELSKEKQQ